MQTLQKAGAYALILGVKCLRRALGTLGDIQEGRPLTFLACATEIRALRDEVNAVHASLRQIKATPGASVAPRPDRLLLQ